MMLWPGKQRERAKAWAEELRRVYDEECERDLFQLRGQHHNLPVALRRWSVAADPPGPGEELESPLDVARHITGNTADRVFLTGDRGSGKTVLLRQAQKEILRNPSYGRLVPVLLRLADWQEGEGLEDWIVETVRRMPPNPPESVLRRLLQERRMVLLLDGLDEIGDEEDRLQRAERVMNDLNLGTQSMLVTCRSELAKQLATRNQIPPDTQAVATSAVGIEDTVRLVRQSCTSGGVADRLEVALKSNPTGALANRLSVPLFLRVIVDMSIDDPEAIELERFALAPAWESDLNSVESHLFGVWIAQTSLRPRWRRSPSGGRETKNRYTIESITRWSQSIARYLQDFGGSRVGGDVLPHTLIFPHYLWLLAGAKQVRAAVVLLTLLLWTPLLVCFWLASVRNSVPEPTTLIIASLLGLGIALSLIMVLGVIRPLYINIERVTTAAGLARSGLPRLAIGALVTLGLATLTSYLAGTVSGLAFAAGFFIAFGLGLATAVRPDIDLIGAASSAAAVGAGIQLATLSLLRSGSFPLALIIGAGTGAMALIAATVVGSIAWKRSGKESLAFEPTGVADPFFRLRADMNTAGIIFLLAGSMVFVAARFTPILSVSIFLACVGSISAGLAAGPGLVSVAWRRYFCMLCLAHKRLPFRLRPFLEWCYEAGFLRRSAAAYEFRHEQLRMHLLHLPQPISADDLHPEIQHGWNSGPSV
jgi:hypothetical protein